jgi:hypothetical protein
MIFTSPLVLSAIANFLNILLVICIRLPQEIVEMIELMCIKLHLFVLLCLSAWTCFRA